MDYDLDEIHAWIEPTLSQDVNSQPDVTLPLDVAHDIHRVLERFKAYEHEVEFLRRKPRREDRLQIDRYKNALTQINATMTTDVNRLKQVARDALRTHP